MAMLTANQYLQKYGDARRGIDPATPAENVGVTKGVPSRSPTSPQKRPLPRGRQAFGDTLPIDVVFAKWPAFERALKLKYPKRAPMWTKMSLTMLKLASFYKSCWPSAAWVTGRSSGRKHAHKGEVLASRKAFFKMIAFMEKEGLIERHESRQPGGRQTSNDYDLRGLVRWLMATAKTWNSRVLTKGKAIKNEVREVVDGVLWVKRSGFWTQELAAGFGGNPPPLPVF